MKFEKVSREQFLKDCNAEDAEQIYDSLKKPARATSGSAGYDVFAPFGFELKAGESIKIPTGFKAQIDEAWALFFFPRSGLGFKYRLQLDNTIGVVDSDYYNCEANEGHMFLKLTNDSKEGKTLSVEAGQAIAQGIFLPYGIVEDDDADGERTGGFGSTG